MPRNHAVALGAIFALTASSASACFIACRPTDEHAREVVNHLLQQRYHAPFALLSYETTRTADFDMIAGEMRGYEIFFKATVKFPEGANLDCAPDAARRAADCTDDSYFSLIRPTRPVPDQRQYIEPNGVRTFDEDLRFAELGGGWKGPDGQLYQP